MSAFKSRKRPTRSSVGTAEPILQLWMLRILMSLGGHRQFIKQHGFQNDALAYVLGLVNSSDKDVAPDDWDMSSSDDFDMKSALSTLRARHHEAEKQWSNASVTACLHSNVKRISDLVGLNEVECKLLEFVIMLHTDQLLETTADFLDQVSSNKLFGAIAVMC